MNALNTTGLFGKLPSHGDFIYRDLPNSFMEVWDNWLQLFVSGTQDQIGQEWLDIYLTSPIWRFTLSSGVVDEHCWAGILLPSVDRVGRYFPFSIVSRLPSGLNATEVHCSQSAWFDQLEQIACNALNGEYQIDELVSAINQQPLSADSLHTQTVKTNDSTVLMSSPLLVQAGHDDQPLHQLLPQLLDTLLTQQMNSYSVWSTRGSERVQPCMFTSQSLPAVKGIAALLDGNWAHWQWQEPYPLKQNTASAINDEVIALNE